MSNTQRTESRSHQIDMDKINPNPKGNGSHSSKYAKFNKEKRDKVLFWLAISIFILGVTLCILSLTVQSLKQNSIRGFAMWQLCLLITTLLGGPVVSKTISNFILFCIRREYSAKENLMYYLIGLVESAWVVLWFGLIFLAWNWVVDEPSYLGVPHENQANILRKFDSTERFITLTLITILLGSILWLLKNVFMKYGKSTFHVRRFFDRIRESLIHEYRIKALSIQTPDELDKCKLLSFGRENVCGNIEDWKFDLSKLKGVDQETVSCWTMKSLIDDIVKERYLAFQESNGEWKEINEENVIDDATNIIYSKLAHDGDQGVQHLEKGNDEENATNSGQVDQGVQHLDSTLSKYFDEEEVQKVSQWLLEGAEFKKVDREVIKKCLRRAWKFRKSLVGALQDNKLLFRDLNRFVDVVLVMIIMLVWAVMLNVEVRRAMVFVGSAIVGSAFIFGDFCKKILDDFTFVFMAHPFDVGDSCRIQDTLVTIEKITLLTTRVLTLEEEMRFYPNCMLCSLPISNYTRSPPRMGDSVVFPLDIGTSPKIIDELKEKINKYIKEKSHYWHQDHEFEMEFDPGDSTKMKATLRVKHAISYHDYHERQIRKSQLISHLLNCLHDLNLVQSSTTTPSQQPTPNINKEVSTNE